MTGAHLALSPNGQDTWRCRQGNRTGHDDLLEDALQTILGRGDFILCVPRIASVAVSSEIAMSVARP